MKNLIINKLKDKRNNKGFSMVELLAVIVILGVISTIGIAAVSKLVERSRNDYYLTQQKQMILATQAYVNDNRNLLPKQIGSFTSVKLKELMDKKYITDKVVDQNKTPCDPENSRVDIYKASTTDYKYVGYLECEACRKNKSDSAKCYDENDKKAPVITINIPNVSSNQSVNTNSAISIDIKGSADDTNIKVSSYSYKIYVDGVLKKNSGLLVNNKESTLTINKEKIFNYVPGNIKVVVTATNTDGITKSKSSTNDLSDVLSPACGRITYENNNKLKDYDYVNPNDIKCGSTDYPWINIGQPSAIRQAWVLCNDEFKLGCAQHEFSAVLNSEGENKEVTIKDKKGNPQTCRIKNCIDRTTPKIIVNIKSGTTIKETFIVNGQGTSQTYNTSYTHPTWLNKTNYPDGVTVEVIVTDATSRLKSFSWYQNSAGQKTPGTTNSKVHENNSIKDSDYNDSGQFVKSQTITEDGVRKQVITVEDKAGNKTIYNLTIKIDRTAPSSCTNVLKLGDASGSTYDTSKWTNNSVYTTASCSADAMSGCSTSGNKITTTGSTTNVTNESHETWTVHAQGTSHTQFKVRDIAGNYKTCSQNTEYVDKTAPTCSIAGDGVWSTEGALITTTCTKNDSYSNLATCQGSAAHRSNANVTYTTSDAAGNSSTCTYNVTSCTQHRRSTCSTYNTSYESCGCQTNDKCRRISHGKVSSYYSNNNDDAYFGSGKKSNMNTFIENGLKEIAGKLNNAEFNGSIQYQYYRNHNFKDYGNDEITKASEDSGCTNIGYDTLYNFKDYNAIILYNTDKATCFASKVQAGNFYTSGRWINDTCYLGVSNYYWECNTSSHRKHVDVDTYSLKSNKSCCSAYNACEAAGCATWGAWSEWSCDTSSCSGNSCQSEERVAYK